MSAPSQNSSPAAACGRAMPVASSRRPQSNLTEEQHGHRRSAAWAARLALAVGLALLIGGCSILRPEAGPGEVIYQDDFSRSNSGWDRYQDPTYSSDYQNGVYRLHVLTPDTDAWANPHLDVSDAQIEVDARKVGGSDHNVFGLLCRYQDPRNFYFFFISSDGYNGIGVMKDGTKQLLTDKSLLPSEAVAQGGALNHIRADCDGYALRLFVNGELVAEAQAAEWSSGDLGLIAGTYELGGTEVLFDNFSAVRPETP